MDLHAEGIEKNDENSEKEPGLKTEFVDQIPAAPATLLSENLTASQPAANSVQQQSSANYEVPRQDSSRKFTRLTIWWGDLEWQTKAKNSTDTLTRLIRCQMTSECENAVALKLKANSWPLKLNMQLMPEPLIIKGSYFKNSTFVELDVRCAKARERLRKELRPDFVGCVFFKPLSAATDRRNVMILRYSIINNVFTVQMPRIQRAFVVRRLEHTLTQRKQNLIQRPRRGTQEIWCGTLQWADENVALKKGQRLWKATCRIAAKITDGEPQVKADSWPRKLSIILVPKKEMVRSTQIFVQLPNSAAVEKLKHIMSSRCDGLIYRMRCVHSSSPAVHSDGTSRLIFLKYSASEDKFYGLLPRNVSVVHADETEDALRHQWQMDTTDKRVEEEQRWLQRYAQPVWNGVLKWNTPIDAKFTSLQKSREVQCQVSVEFETGEPEVKTDSWPQKLNVRFMSHQQNKNIKKYYLKNSTSIRLNLGPHPVGEKCNWADFVSLQCTHLCGLVPFTFVPSPTPGDMELLILLYSPRYAEFVGYIPNNPLLVLAHMWKYFRYDKTMQVLMRQMRAQTTRPTPGIQQDAVLSSTTSVTMIHRRKSSEIIGHSVKVAGPREVEHTMGNNSPMCPNNQMPGPQYDGTGTNKKSSDDTREMIRKRGSFEITQLHRSMDCQPAVGNHSRTAVEHAETTQTPIQQIQEETVSGNTEQVATSTSGILQGEILVSQRNCTAIAGREDNHIEEVDVPIIEPEEKRYGSVDVTTIVPAQSTQGLTQSNVYEIKEEEILIIEPEEQEQEHKHVHLMGDGESQPLMLEAMRENENFSGGGLETARRLNILQIGMLLQALDTELKKKASVQQALEIVQQEITNISHSLESAQRQEKLYEQLDRNSSSFTHA